MLSRMDGRILDSEIIGCGGNGFLTCGLVRDRRVTGKALLRIQVWLKI